MEESVIELNKVYKEFEIDHSKANSVKSLFTSLLNKERDQSNIQKVLKSIDIQVKKGEFLGIVGRNGSGKSTLLKILAGIYKPTKGHIRIDGRLVPFIELGVGFNGELSGKENIYLNGAMLGFTRSEIDAMYDDIVEFSGLGKHMTKQLKNYSSGMQVRLAFSIAIRSDADVLLIDEVLAVGDTAFQKKCYEYFGSLKKNEKTVVFVSHDMAAIEEYCNRAILIEKGKIIAEGKPNRVSKMYLQLFQNEDKTKKDLGSQRWGDESVVYTSINTKLDNQRVLIELEARASKDVDRPNFGFVIKDIQGQPITGTNTNLEYKKVESVKAGDIIKLKWSFENIFNTGKYFVEPAIVRQNGDVCDWWENASFFNVSKNSRTPYPAYPKIEVEIVV